MVISNSLGVFDTAVAYEEQVLMVWIDEEERSRLRSSRDWRSERLGVRSASVSNGSTPA